jgi:hypothetical protein
MSGYLETFNQMKPQERRFVVIVGLVVFVIINWLAIWPHFGDLGIAQTQMAKAETDIARDRKEIAHKQEYIAAINRLMQSGYDVEQDDQASSFSRRLQEIATDSGVEVESIGRPVVHTNDPFFVEQEVGINALCNETNMVHFLYSLGSENSMMRVRAVSLRPDQKREALSAALTVVASYQKTQPVRSTGAVAPPAKPGAPPGPPPVGRPVSVGVPIIPGKPVPPNRTGN